MDTEEKKQRKRARLRAIKRGKGKGKYFSQEEEQAVIDFLEAETLEEKQEIYTKRLHKGIEKIAEGVLQMFHLQNDVDYEDFKNDCIAQMYYVLLHKFDRAKMTKAFSYLSVTTKNKVHASLNKRNRYRGRFISVDMMKLERSLEDLERMQELTEDETYNKNPEFNKKVLKDNFIIEDFQDIDIESENFQDFILEYGAREEFRNILYSYRSKLRGGTKIIKVLNSIIDLFDELENIGDINKPHIREKVESMTGMNEKEVYSTLSALKFKIRKNYRNKYLLKK